MQMTIFQRGVARGGGAGGHSPSKHLADQLTLFKPGGRLCPSHYCQPPGIQKATYTSEFVYTRASCLQSFDQALK